MFKSYFENKKWELDKLTSIEFKTYYVLESIPDEYPLLHIVACKGFLLPIQHDKWYTPEIKVCVFVPGEEHMSIFKLEDVAETLKEAKEMLRRRWEENVKSYEKYEKEYREKKEKLQKYVDPGYFEGKGIDPKSLGCTTTDLNGEEH